MLYVPTWTEVVAPPDEGVGAIEIWYTRSEGALNGLNDVQEVRTYENKDGNPDFSQSTRPSPGGQ